MSDFDLVSADLPPARQPYVVTCSSCPRTFDAADASWCTCPSNLRTLQCPDCGACFCKASYPYKRKFWNGAPKELREHTSRFGMDAPQETAPSVEWIKEPAVRPERIPSVLIVDDEEPIRSLAACFVESMGYEVTTVDNPEEAVLMTDAIRYDVVLTDALMPKMDGRELCRRLKVAHGDEIKVILMTSLYTASRFRTEARHVFKVDEYLAKPLRFAELRDALRRVAPI